MFLRLILLFCLLNEMNGDCLYPQWKMRCQKYCMENHFYEIQLNQCYSSDRNQLTCKCNGQLLTDQILNLIELNNSKSMSSSTVESMLDENVRMECVRSKRCSNERMICLGLNEYCKCLNGIWMNISCPNGKRCREDESSMVCVDNVITSFGICSMIMNKSFIFFLLIINQNVE